MARLSRECVITEKIDGSNACIYIGDDGTFLTGSRSRWITPKDDNFGFARWANDHRDELLKLGPGRHFGEWWGAGIQRRYGVTEKRFSLFNVIRWRLHNEAPRLISKSPQGVEKFQECLPACCGLVPVLYRGLFETAQCELALASLAAGGSLASPGFMKPEGIVCFHIAAGIGFKKTIEKDEVPKSLA